MTTIQINLSDEVNAFLEAEAAAKGYPSGSEYVVALLRALQKRQAWDQIEPLVLEGLASPAQEMTPADWQSLRDRIDRIESQGLP